MIVESDNVASIEFFQIGNYTSHPLSIQCFDAFYECSKKFFFFYSTVYSISLLTPPSHPLPLPFTLFVLITLLPHSQPPSLISTGRASSCQNLDSPCLRIQPNHLMNSIRLKYASWSIESKSSKWKMKNVKWKLNF